jgi:hypothetical protein
MKRIPLVGLLNHTHPKLKPNKAMISTCCENHHVLFLYYIGNDAVMGLAAYAKNMRAFKRIVGSLRATGYDGHIILGARFVFIHHHTQILWSSCSIHLHPVSI